MAFRLRRKEPVEDGLQRIALEQIDRALREIDDASLDRREAVHQVRKRCKKIRGLLRLVRPQCAQTHREENAWYRDAARELSFLRDVAASIESLNKLRARDDRRIDVAAFSTTRAALEERRRIAEHDGDLQSRLEQFAEQLRTARRRVESWTLEKGGFAAIGGGVEKTYGRARRAMRQAYADPRTENFHQWRKRVKYHWHHMRLLRGLWKGEMDVRRGAASELSTLLGDEHDLAVLRATLLEDVAGRNNEPGEIQTLIGLIDRRRGELQAAASPLGQRLFAEKPSCLTQRLHGYWRAWRKRTQACPVSEASEIVP